MKHFSEQFSEGKLTLVAMDSQITVTIYGPQGSGKSHLMKKFAAAFKAEVEAGTVTADRLVIEEKHSDGEGK